MSLSIICAHRWGQPIASTFQNDKGELIQTTLRYCAGCATTWRGDMKEPRIVTGYLEETPKPVEPPPEHDA